MQNSILLLAKNLFEYHSINKIKSCSILSHIKTIALYKRLMESKNIDILPSPIKSPHDKKEYRAIKLQNGLQALLISDIASLKEKNICCIPLPAEGDPDEESMDDDESEGDNSEDEDELVEDEPQEIITILEEEEGLKKPRQTRYLSAASLCIGVGSFEDPREIQGLMHFLEHMVFMGSEKYPRENCFDNFIKKSGGSDNAHTDYESTTFYFDVQDMHFEKALHMFAQFFISPLMKEEAMQRERKSVHSEFQEAVNDDDCRKQQIFASLAENHHPMSSFTYGNETTLQLEISDKELHSKLHHIRSLFYSAQYMTLVVQSRDNLDRLQEMVVQIFSEIPNNGLPKPTYEKFGFPFGTEKFHRFYKVIPVNDRHTLDMNWALPSLLRHYECKPLHYISYLIGHEGLGSIISYFKKRVWAIDIYAGNDESGFEHNSTYALFNIRVHLTDEGFDHLREVILVIFQYIHLLQTEGPVQKIFSEIQKMEQIDFDYAEERNTSDNVQELSESMQLYPSHHILTGSSLLYKYDPKLIKDCLAELKPSKCNLMLSSKKYDTKDLALQEEKWFGTKYLVEDIPMSWIQEWEMVSLHPDLHLPAPNDFIPDDFEVFSWKGDRNPPQYPCNIQKSSKGELWYKQDFKFCLPRAYCYVYFFLDVIKKTPKMGAMLDLFLNLFNQHIMEALYPARMAQYETEIKAADWGFTIKVNGFNQNLFKCLELILSQMKDFENCLDDKAFEEMKQQQIKGYHNAILSPDVLRRDTRLVILQEVHWQVVEKMKALQSVTKEDLLTEFLQNLLSMKYIKMLVQGNITRDQAENLYNLVVSSGSETSHTSHDGTQVKCPEMRTRRLKPGEWFTRIQSLNPASTNSTVVNYYQGERGCLRTELLNEFIIMAMDEPVFDTLRTKEQLGYHVYCTNRNTYGVLGISVTVNSQANKYSVTHINERIEAFLKVFAENLKNVSDEEMNSLKDTLRNYKLTVDLTLKEEVDRNWVEIISGECFFSRHVNQLELIPSITSKEVSAYLQRIIFASNNESYRKLSVQVVGSSCPEKGVVPCHEDTLKKPAEELLVFMSVSEEEVKSAACLSDQFICHLRPFAEQMICFEALTRLTDDNGELIK